MVPIVIPLPQRYRPISQALFPRTSAAANRTTDRVEGFDQDPPGSAGSHGVTRGSAPFSLRLALIDLDRPEHEGIPSSVARNRDAAGAGRGERDQRSRFA